jgi:hypothetical protein
VKESRLIYGYCAVQAVVCRSVSKGINGSLLHSRDVYVLLLSVPRAGVFEGLNSETKSRFPTTHPPDGWWVFSFWAQIDAPHRKDAVRRVVL